MSRKLQSLLFATLFALAAFPTLGGGFDGSGNCVRDTGVYTGSSVWQNTRDAGRAIRADDMDTHDNFIVGCIENTVTRDGQNAPTANLPMGGYHHTNVGSSTARTNYGTVAQIQDGDYLELGTVSGTDTITASASPTITAYAQGQTFRFVAAGTNTGATTLNINSVGAKAIQKRQSALAAGDIASGDVVVVYYDGTQFQMLSPIRTEALAGADGTILTGTAGTDTYVPKWNSDGDLVDGYAFLDEDDMSSNSATAVPSQQSVKAYVDNNAYSITLGTEQATTSGTAVGFTSIASGTKRLVFMLEGVSLDASGDLLIQLGDSGGYETAGYTSNAGQLGGGDTDASNGFILTHAGGAADVFNGNVILTLKDAANFTWTATAILNEESGSLRMSAGVKSLSAELDRIQITRTGSGDFDAGSVNIQSE